MNINLHIERLVLEGLPVEARHSALVREAIEAELSHLLSNGGVSSGLQSGGVLHRVQADALQLNADSNATQIGQQIAQSIYGSIGQ
jgi:hypothetical protein